MMIILSLDAVLFVVCSVFFFFNFLFLVSTPHPTDFVTLHKRPQHSASQFSDL